MQPSESLRHAVLECYRALSRHDEAFVKEFFADGPDALMVGTLDHEWYDGSRIVEAFVEQFRLLPEARFEPGEVAAYEHGEVGWFADRPVLRATGQPTVACRLTGVAVRADGRWTIVQSHLSLARREET